VAVAVSCSETPRGVEELAGVIAIAVTEAAATVKLLVPETPPKLAVITVAPALTGTTNPFVPPLVPTLATCGFDEDQLACAVTLPVVPLE
jgi:hypothetical protein